MYKREAKFQLEHKTKCALNVNSAFKLILFMMLLLTVFTAFSQEKKAQQTKAQQGNNEIADFNKPIIEQPLAPYPIAVALEQLSDLVAVDPQQAEQLLLTFKQATTTFADTQLGTLKLTGNNVSAKKVHATEQYLLYLIEATIKQFHQQHRQAIKVLNQAKTLETAIAEQQLNTPLFINLYALLAKSYVAIADYEQAYQAKNHFIEKFAHYSDKVKDDKIALLTQEYEISSKIKANELLSQQNKLKVFTLAKVKKEQHHQQLLFILLTVSVFIFVVLFLRQLAMTKKLLLLSKTDRLTGITNRTTFFVQGKILKEQMVTEQKELSLLMFTVDCFNNIIDDYGHAVGDELLSKIANLIGETMRARDLFARLDQDNFIIMLPDTDINKAKAIAVRVMEKMSQYDFTRFTDFKVNNRISLSIGISNIKDTPSTFDQLIHAADLAMYEAKKNGGNQMVNYATINEKQERRANSK